MGLRENLRREPISQLELHKAVTVRPQTPVHEAIEALRRESVGAVIVTDDDGRPAGMFTEKLLIRLLVYRPEATHEPVASHMSARIECLKADEPIARLISTMQRHALRWVCVVDGDGRPTALADLRGVIEYVVDHFPRLVKVQPIEPRLSIENREGA